MTDAKLIERYEYIRKGFGPSFAPDFGGYTMQRDLDGVVISLEPPQEGLGSGKRTEVLLTAYLRDGTPEELSQRLYRLITKRDVLDGTILTTIDTPEGRLPREMAYSGTLRDFDEGIEYVYDVPTSDELELAQVVRDFGSI